MGISEDRELKALFYTGKCKGEHGDICTRFENAFSQCPKIPKKYARVHVVVSMCAPKVLSKNDFYLSCVKKTKICHMYVLCKSQKFLFSVEQN